MGCQGKLRCLTTYKWGVRYGSIDLRIYCFMLPNNNNGAAVARRAKDAIVNDIIAKTS